MRAVLDESVPKRLARALKDRGHDVHEFPAAWRGLQNGRLLDEAEASGFRCLLTSDRNLRHQQTILGRPIALVVLPAQRYEDLLPYLGRIEAALVAVASGKTIILPRSPHLR